MTTIKELLEEISKQQDIINAETESADLGHGQSMARVIEAEQRKEELQERVDALTLCFSFSIA
jgi:hypothetical protein